MSAHRLRLNRDKTELIWVGSKNNLRRHLTLVTTRVDYCNCLLVGAPKTTTDRLQRVMDAAARVVTNMKKFDHGLSHVRRHEHQILTLCQRLQMSTSDGMASQYLSERCTPVAEMPGRRHLRSAGRGQLHTPRFRLTNYGGRSFCCAAPSTWNCLPDALKDTDLSLASFQKQLETFLFSRYWHIKRDRGLWRYRAI